MLENVARQVLVAAQFPKPAVHVLGIDGHRLAVKPRRIETDLVQKTLHDGGKAPVCLGACGGPGPNLAKPETVAFEWIQKKRE